MGSCARQVQATAGGGGEIARVDDLDRLARERAARERLAPLGNSGHEGLQLLRISSDPIFLRTWKLPSRFFFELLAYVLVAPHGGVGRVSRQPRVPADVGVGHGVGEIRG